jgi:hypothetical protein
MSHASSAMSQIQFGLIPNSRPLKREANHEMRQVQWRKMHMGFLFPYVSELLKSWTKYDLLLKAKEICETFPIPQPDRLSQRHREALLCWYAVCQVRGINIDFRRANTEREEVLSDEMPITILEPSSPIELTTPRPSIPSMPMAISDLGISGSQRKGFLIGDHRCS